MGGGGFNVNYTAGGRLDAPFYPSKPIPYIKGQIMNVSGANAQMEYEVPFDVEFLGVAVGASRYDTLDNWTVTVNGVPIVETIYTKDLPEGMFFTVLIPLNAGDKISFLFINASGQPKDVWFNYQFLRDEV